MPKILNQTCPLPEWKLDEILEEQIRPKFMERFNVTWDQCTQILAIAKEQVEERYVIDRRPRDQTETD